MKRALLMLGFCGIGMAGAEAAPVAFSCPLVIGTDVLVADVEAGKGQIFGADTVRATPNYGLVLKVQQQGDRIFFIPPFNPGGGRVIPGYEASALRLETNNGNLVSEEYASERVLGTCTPIEPVALAEFVIPAATPGTNLVLSCVPYDTSGPTPDQWTPIPAETFSLTFDTAAATVTRQDTAGGAGTQFGWALKDTGEKIVFADQPGSVPTGFALNRYSGNLFQSSDVAYSAGRFTASCTPAGGPA